METLKETLENLSKTQYEKQFRLNYNSLEPEAKEAVAEAIQELVSDYLTQPWNHPEVKFIQSEGEIWRLKVGNRGQTVDHRIFFDIHNNGLLFLSVKHRDQAYQ